MKNSDFVPDWASPPGDTIADVMRQKDIPLQRLAAALDATESFVSDLLAGRQHLTAVIAQRLAGCVGGSPTFWSNREAQFRVALNRRAEGSSVDDLEDDLPLDDMVTLGWLPEATTKIQRLASCFQFFDVTDVRTLRQKYLKRPELVAFRTSPTFASELGAVAAWLRRGEVLAANMECAAWNADSLRAVLPTLRRLTRNKNPKLFLPELTRILAGCGVAALLVRAPRGCRASGATKFLARDKALLLLSARYLSDDHFWFSVFHEVGHLLLHSRDAVFVDGIDQPVDAREREANAFAVNTLVPPEFQDEMLSLPVRGMAVVSFAHKVGIAPGIVVGQLQHRGRLARNQLNNLKRRYKWT